MVHKKQEKKEDEEVQNIFKLKSGGEKTSRVKNMNSIASYKLISKI